jgi:hypothetical protein
LRATARQQIGIAGKPECRGEGGVLEGTTERNRIGDIVQNVEGSDGQDRERPADYTLR